MKIGAISLGCDKNRVDTENLLGFLTEAGHEIVSAVDMADAVLINTCSFLKSAVKESLETVFEARAVGSVKYVIVAGCLPLRYLSDLTGEEGLSEADAFITPDCYDRIDEVLERVSRGERVIMTGGSAQPKISESRVITTPYHYAYLRIADGCDNHCTFCAIPGIRGRYRSEEKEAVLQEASRLIGQGVRELILVAQDVTRYGSDRGEDGGLIDLLRGLVRLPIERIRLLYCYPDKCTEELIDFIDAEPKMAKYIDMPMQHASDSVLKRMNRRDTASSLMEKIAYVRSKKSDIAIRSTFMVGFPGETEEEFQELCAFLEKARLDHVGFFAYSREEGTPAARMKGQVSAKVKKERLTKVIDLQSHIACERAEKMIDQVLVVTYDGIDYDKECFYGHADRIAPDADEKVYFTSAESVEIGESYPVRIVKTDKLDLYGVALECER